MALIQWFLKILLKSDELREINKQKDRNMTPKYSIERMLQPPLTCIIPFIDIQQILSFSNKKFH